jgi:hypothetical protein
MQPRKGSCIELPHLEEGEENSICISGVVSNNHSTSCPLCQYNPHIRCILHDYLIYTISTFITEVDEWCISVSRCTSCLSLQTTAVQSSLAQIQYCLVSVNCPKAVKSCDIPFLLGHGPTTTDSSLCCTAK